MQKPTEASMDDHRDPRCKRCVEHNCAECTQFGTSYTLIERGLPLWTAEERRKHLQPLSELIKKKYKNPHTARHRLRTGSYHFFLTSTTVSTPSPARNRTSSPAKPKPYTLLGSFW